jgi:threonine dehydrogenase-like Zn-dependent dehydrogenase
MVMNEVVVVIGAGSIGQAIARRVSAGKRVVLADLRQANADAAAEVMADAGFEVSTATVDVSSRERYGLGTLHGEPHHFLIFPRNVNGADSAIIILLDAGTNGVVQLDQNGSIHTENH